ncbi:hypothetical protein BJ912DRAFT_855388 [Pholiota molesta]|nr:hypothetical protein BJ912DRAFT_855388 [Pholiota molesta]
MWHFLVLFPLLCLAASPPALSRTSALHDFAWACYENPLPSLTPSLDNRSIPWGTPSIVNGTSICCSSLDEVRAGIDAIDAQLLELLSRRQVVSAAFVREATRFKGTVGEVDVPSRDSQVIAAAVASATAMHLPQSIASVVFTAIINASVPFELCVFDSFHERGY